MAFERIAFDRAVWQEPRRAGMPSLARTALLPVSCTVTAKPFCSMCTTQSWQQPQLGSFQTSTAMRVLGASLGAVGAAAHSEGAANAVQARAMRRSALRRGWADAMRSCFMGCS